MSVSIETPAQPKPKRDWVAIRHEYESGTISQRGLAQRHGIPENTVMRHAMREKWIQPAKLVRKSAGEIRATIKASVQQTVEDKLAPFIEREKVKITKTGAILSRRGMLRIAKLWKQTRPGDAKEEADAARALESLVRTGRTSLGMNDGSAATGPINIGVLCNQAAIQQHIS